MRKIWIAMISALLLAGCGQSQPNTAGGNNSEPNESKTETSETADIDTAETAPAETAETVSVAHEGPLEFTDFAEVVLSTNKLSGFGEIEVNIDYEKLDEIIGRDKLIDTFVELETANGKEDIVNAELESMKRDTISRIFVNYVPGVNNGRLNNGDVITLKGVTYIAKDGNLSQTLQELNEKTGLDFPLSYEYTVSGLEEPVEKLDLMLKDPQQYISIKPNGLSSNDLVDGNIKLDVKFPDSYTNDDVYYMRKTDTLKYEVVKDNERFGSITYEPVNVEGDSFYVKGYDNLSNYSSGDTITFELQFDNENMLQSEKKSIPDRFFKYTIGTVNEYVTSVDDISDSDIDDLIECDAEFIRTTDPVVAVFKGKMKPEYTITDHDGFVIGIVRKQDQGMYYGDFYYAINRKPDGSVTSSSYFGLSLFTDDDSIPTAEMIETKDYPLSPNEKYTYERIR